jgi:hypothetical protein
MKLFRRQKYISRYNPTSIIYVVTYLNSGYVNITIKSDQQLYNRDKLSMKHSQNGIAIIIPYDDMLLA